MYTIKVDDQLLYSPELLDAGYRVLNPTLHLEVNMAGSLAFLLPPENVMHDAIHKMKSIITVEQDGEIIFRGRVTEETTDNYKQNNVYCEGELSFLLDSVQAPCKYTGTAAEIFVQLVERHNAQVEEDKRFAVGEITAVDDEDTLDYEVKGYDDTSSTMETLLLNVFGGYLRTRHENGLHYLDYVDTFRRECAQKIEFGVNLLNIENQVNAQEICTVLIPLGKADSNGKPLTIETVNDGSPYIENPAGIALFGRICKTYTWGSVNSASELLALGNEYLQGVALTETLTIHAVDLHLLDVDTDAIRPGDTVHLLSAPHGMDRKSICAAMDIDLQNGDMSSYTFGLTKRTLTALESETKKQVQTVSGSTDTQYEIIEQIQQTQTEQKETNNAELETLKSRMSRAELRIDGAEAEIDLKASQETVDALDETVNALGERVSSAELRLDGAEAEIELKASQESVDALGESIDVIGTRVSSAELRLDGAEAEIDLKASQKTVDALDKSVDTLGERVSSAEARIDGAEAEIDLKASQKTVDALDTRVSSAELRLDGAEAAIDLKASQEYVDELASKISSAEVRIDGAEAEIALKAGQETVDELGKRVTNAEIRIDGAEAKINLKANQEIVDALGERVTNAEIEIDGANAKIDLKASQSEVTDLATRLSGAEVWIDGAKAEIGLKAAQAEVDAISEKVSNAEIRIDGAEAAIELKANQTDVTELGTRLSGAEIKIDAATAAIELKAGQGTVDALGERVTTAEVRIDGAESAIALKADKIDLEGYVTMEDFEAVEGWATTFASERVETPWLEGGTVNADEVIAPNLDVDVADIGALTVEATAAAWKEGTFVVNLDITQNKNNCTVMLADGTTKFIQYVESVTITPRTSYIKYLGSS